MIKSMTGFGRSKYEIDGREYIIEIKSVNHKYNDVSIRLPRSISYLEEEIKKEVSQCISRGKVDVYISFINTSDKNRNLKINTELAKAYIKELKKLADETKVNANIEIMEVSKLPEVLIIQNDEQDTEILEEVKKTLQEALHSFVEMRKKEGEKIAFDLEQRIEIINEKIKEIMKYSTGLIEEYIVKLETRIKEILKIDIIDETRLAQEVVFFADKSSVEEEVTRLKSHTEQFLNLIKKDIPCGKKLDFIVQEINREINTIGSKANCLEITNLVIEMKTEVENIREQIQNIE